MGILMVFVFIIFTPIHVYPNSRALNLIFSAKRGTGSNKKASEVQF